MDGWKAALTPCSLSVYRRKRLRQELGTGKVGLIKEQVCQCGGVRKIADRSQVPVSESLLPISSREIRNGSPQYRAPLIGGAQGA